MRCAVVRGWGKLLTCCLACALPVWAPSSALAVHVGCGAIVTEDTTLDSDIVDCPGNGVHIQGRGITLDLAGHLIDGTGGPFGVLALPNSSDVTVTGGQVRQFHDAVWLEGRGRFTARDLEVSESHDGILLTVTSGVVERVLAWGNNGSGINMPGSQNVLVTDSVMVANGAGISGAAVTLSRFQRTLFDRNTFHGLRFAGLTDSELVQNRIQDNGTFGLRLEEGSTGNLVSRNKVNGSGSDGIALGEDSGTNRLELNHSTRNGGDGFDVAGPGATLVRNRAFHNGALGFDAPLGVALDVRNIARRNGEPRQCVGVDCDRRR